MNTGLTYALYLLLLLFLPYPLAYSITYAAGIFIGYLMNAYWVFRRKPELRTAVTYPATYAVNYMIAVGLLWVLVERLGVSERLAPLAVLVVTTPTMYLMSRTVFSQKGKQ